MTKVRGAPAPVGVPVRKITQQLKAIQQKRGWSAQPAWLKYGLALLVTGAVLGLGLLLLRLVPAMEAPVLLFAFGVLLSARFGGLGPGLAATFLGTLAFDYAFLGTMGRFRPDSPAEQIHTLLLLGVGVFCCFLMEEMHRTRQRADDDAQALAEGERFLQNLVRNLPGAAYRCRNNPERTLEYISEGAFALSGYRPIELIENRSLSLSQLVHPEDRPWVFREIQKALEEERPYHFVYRIRTAFGKEKWAWEKGQAVYSPEGELLALEGFLIDVTERKQAEDAIRESELRFRTMADNAPVMIWLSGKDARCTYLNKQWYDFTAATQKESLGFGWLSSVHPEDRKCAKELFLRANQKREAFRLEYRLKRYDGFYCWVIASASPRFNPQGGFLGHIGSVIDIHERKQAEEKLETLLTQEQTGRQRATFLAEASDILAGSLDDMATLQAARPAQKPPPVAEEGALGLLAEASLPAVLHDAAPASSITGALQAVSAQDRPDSLLSVRSGVLEQALVRLLVPRLADFAAVCLLDETGALGPEHPLVVASIDPEARRAMQELRRRYPPRKSHPFWEVLRSRRVCLFTPSDPLDLEKTAQDEEHRRLLAPLRWRSSLVAPLVTRGRTLGVLCLGSNERLYEETDRSLLEDIGRRAALSIENACLYREAKNAIRVRDEFLSIASHELKTPLTPMRLKLQSLLRLCQKSTQAELALQQITPKLEITVRQVDRLHRLIEELLDISRISVGKLELEPEPVDLTALLNEVLERFSEELRRANCPFRLKAPEELWGSWDRLRLEQILANLLSNAIKYGAGQPVEITLEADEKSAWLRVRDHGIGIDPGDQERIFQRFERAVSERHYGGFGLGLWITRQIAEAAGGSVSVYSRPGQGSLFTLELPRG